MATRRLSESLDPALRPRSRLSRRFALYLLPLVLIPILLMGLAAYLRSRSIIEDQAISHASSSAAAQVEILREWTRVREQRLLLGSQRQDFLNSVSALLTLPEGSSGYIEGRRATLSQLEDLRLRAGEVLFSHILVARASDGQVLVSTIPEWEGMQISDNFTEPSFAETLVSFPLVDDPLVAPRRFGLVSTIPVRASSAETADILLIGTNLGVQLGTLMEDLQTLWEQRGAYRIQRGNTYIALSSGFVLHFGPYSTEPEVLPLAGHPVLAQVDEKPSGTLEYVNTQGVPVLAAYDWIPSWDLGVIVELPQEEVFSQINDLVPFSLALIVVVAVLTLVVVILTTNRLLRPLGTLTQSAVRISRGEWDVPIPEERDDELGVLAATFNRMTTDLSSLYHKLEDRVASRTRQIRIASEIARRATSSATLDELLRQSVSLIQDRFGYHFVAVFLLDEDREHAVLRESAGAGRQAGLMRGHRVGVGSPSVVGWVTANNQPRVVVDVNDEIASISRELLPLSRSEAAVPLQVEGRVIGAISVHATRSGGLRRDYLEVLQTLADQLSTAIEKTRLAELSMAAASRARLISEVTGELRGLMDVEEVMRMAALAVHSALGDTEIMIELAAGDGTTGAPPPLPSATSNRSETAPSQASGGSDDA